MRLVTSAYYVSYVARAYITPQATGSPEDVIHRTQILSAIKQSVKQDFENQGVKVFGGFPLLSTHRL